MVQTSSNLEEIALADILLKHPNHASFEHRAGVLLLKQLQKLHQQSLRISQLEAGLKFYASNCHFTLSDRANEDEDINEQIRSWCDATRNVTVADGTFAALVLKGADLFGDPKTVTTPEVPHDT